MNIGPQRRGGGARRHRAGPPLINATIEGSCARSIPTRAKLAAEVLGGVPDARGTAVLSRALVDEDANVRVTAAEALGNAALAGEESRNLATEALATTCWRRGDQVPQDPPCWTSLARLETRLSVERVPSRS